MKVTDAHLHAFQCAPQDFFYDDGRALCYRACTCAHSEEEFFKTEQLSQKIPGLFCIAFGMHPQKPLVQNAGFLENLLQDKKICAIGECGFDLFTPTFKSNLSVQEEAWNIQIRLAVKYGVPIIVHDRKALDFIFRDKKILCKIPYVVFHSFAFTSREAKSILDKNINAFFSFGKPVLNGNKKSMDCVINLPLEHLLFETDAPYQTLKGESFTPPGDIFKVYEKASELRGCGKDELIQAVEKNFNAVFASAFLPR